MVLAINFIDRCDPSNEMCCQLQSKKIKVTLYLALAINVIDRCDPSNEMCCQLQSKKIKVTLY